MTTRMAAPACRMPDRVVLGIDPGLASMGVAVIAKRNGELVPLTYDCIRTGPGQRFPERLALLHRACQKLIAKYRPDVLAMERLFFSKNVRTAMVVGQAQGAVLLAVAGRNVEVVEYTPREVKMAVTGDGSADKAAVALMVQRILRLAELPRPDDAADALAVAYCHLVSTRVPAR